MEAHILADKIKAIGVSLYKIPKCHLAESRHSDVIWNDEELFTIEGSVEERNNRIPARRASDVKSNGRIVSDTEHPQ
ncbi:hypothetical protein Aduo_018390 [Ancylostoma duodenale]